MLLIMVDVPPGAEESRTRELEARRERFLQCIRADQIGLVSRMIFTLQGTKELEEVDFEKISVHVLGVFQDDKNGAEKEGRKYLVVDCGGQEGSNATSIVRRDMAAFLFHKLGRGGKVWPDNWVSSVSSVAEKIQLLKANPDRFTPLLFQTEPK